MKRVDFLLLDIPSPAAAAQIAREHGWFASPVPAGVLRSLTEKCPALELRNLNAPVGLVLVASKARRRAIGTHTGGGRWGIDAQFREDDEEFDAIVEDAPVVEHLVQLLESSLNQSVHSD